MNEILIIIIIFIILLVIPLFVYSYNISNKEYIYPPFVSSCPSHFYSNNNICTDIKHIYTDSKSNVCYEINTDKPFCEKKKWADNCNINWDGVTNDISKCK
jgi:hypothetical protein